MTCNGWIAARRRLCRSSHGGSAPSRREWSLRPASLHPDLTTLSEMGVGGLREPDARALLDSALTAPLDDQVRDRIIAETGGNPLALLELPRGLSAHDFAGGFGLPAAAQVSAAVEESFMRDVQALPEPTRRLLLLAAAEPLGDPAPLWRAAARFGIRADAVAPAVEAGLAVVRCTRAISPSAGAFGCLSICVRSGQTLGAPSAGGGHRSADRDPDRRAWHRAQATDGPDEEVAAELERSAGRAQARGGLAAAAAFLERATVFTMDPGRRAERALAAASANVDSGAFDAALDLLQSAESSPLSDFQMRAPTCCGPNSHSSQAGAATPRRCC